MGLFSSGPDLNDVIFQLRMSSKQLEREAKRAEKEEKGLFRILCELPLEIHRLLFETCNIASPLNEMLYRS